MIRAPPQKVTCKLVKLIPEPRTFTGRILLYTCYSQGVRHHSAKMTSRVQLSLASLEYLFRALKRVSVNGQEIMEEQTRNKFLGCVTRFPCHLALLQDLPIKTASFCGLKWDKRIISIAAKQILFQHYSLMVKPLISNQVSSVRFRLAAPASPVRRREDQTSFSPVG